MTINELAGILFSKLGKGGIIRRTEVKGFKETKDAIHIAGSVPKDIISEVENKTGKKVVLYKKVSDINVYDPIYKGEELSEFGKILKIVGAYTGK